MDHLSDEQIDLYQSRSGRPEDILAIDDHLFACNSCRSRFRQRSGLKASEYALIELEDSGATHELPYLEIEAYVDGGMAAGERLKLESHMESCATCRDRVADLLLVKASLMTEASEPPVAALNDRSNYSNADEGLLKGGAPARFTGTLPGRHTRLLVGLAAVIFIVFVLPAAIIALRWRRELRAERENVRVLTEAKDEAQRRSDQQIKDLTARLRVNQKEASGQDSGATQAIVALKDGPRVIGLAAGKVEGLVPASPYLSEVLKRALESGTISTPPLDVLRGNTGTMMGEKQDGASAFSLKNPVAAVIEEVRPLFSWTSAGSGAAYVVTVIESGSSRRISSPALTKLQWLSSLPLIRGRIYSWSVRATLPDGTELSAPMPPAPAAKFKVLNSFDENELEQARQLSPPSHLALGVLYGRVGLVRRAQRELKLLVDANPDSTLARHLLGSLHRRDAGSPSDKEP